MVAQDYMGASKTIQVGKILFIRASHDLTRQRKKGILKALLNDGLTPNGQRILSSDSVDQMLTNQLVDQPNFGRRPLPTAQPDLAYPAPELYPLCPAEKAQGWGLGGMISPSVTGRSDGTMQWFGLSNIFWWCDREKGVAGIVGSQILPFADPKVVGLWVGVEQKLYATLERAETSN